jgi:hypothetical protein
MRVGRDVVAQIRRYSDKDHIAEIEWDPHSKVFPHFNGLITVAPDGEDACRLILNGVYTPPIGWFGGIFDRVLGLRLARTTASDLLERIGAQIETI